MGDTPDLFTDAARTEAVADPESNVVEFRKREPQDDDALDALAKAPREPKACRHRKRWIDADQRRVTCGECGDNLDPIWCLLNLVEYRETLRREREWIEAEKRRMTKRQEAAIAKKRRAVQAAEQIRIRENCKRCEGSGFAPAPGGKGVVRCDCVKSGAKMF